MLDRLPATAAELADRFAGPLTFGTAGLRGPLRAGPERHEPRRRHPGRGRPGRLARRARARAVRWSSGTTPGTARRPSPSRPPGWPPAPGGAALLLPRPLPTPVLAYAVRALGRGGRRDGDRQPQPAAGQRLQGLPGRRGWAGRLGAGAQIVPPVDAGDRGGDPGGRAAARRCRSGEPGDGARRRRSSTSYVDGAAAVVDPDGPRDLAVAYTPLHGVGARGARRRVRRGPASPRPAVVPEQAEPDPDVPDRRVPQPGGAGRDGPGCSRWPPRPAPTWRIANDPDADRCAVAVPDRRGGWRMLRGDEVGVLLADHLMRRGVPRARTPPRSCRRRCCGRCAPRAACRTARR